MADTKTLLESDKFYHIYNQSVGNEFLFKSNSNYTFFLRKLKEYLQNYIDFYAYCLMPNHFHLIIKVKDYESLFAEYKNKPNYKKTKAKHPNFIPKLISSQFSHFFNSYAQAFNKENNRKGSLFNNRFKRVHINSYEYLKKVIIYVHNNPVRAGITETPCKWQFSSYNSINSKSETVIKRKELIELFDNLNNFRFCHFL